MFEIPPQVRRYGFAVLAVASALLLTLLLWPLMKPNVTLLFLAAVMFSAWYGGLKPGLLSAILSTVAIHYFLSTLPDLPSMGLADFLRLAIFGLVAFWLSSACEQLRAAKQQAEANLLKLRASEERYRCIIDTAYEGIWTIDANSRTDYVNERMVQMLGYSVEEMIGRAVDEFIDEDALLDSQQHCQRRKQGIKEQFDLRYRCKDGSKLWAIVCSSPILNERGEFNGAIAMITDVTERKQAEEFLKRYQVLFEHSRDIVLFVRFDGQIIEANHAAVRTYGYDKAELLALKIDDLRAPQTHALITEQIDRADKQGILFETIHRRKDGSFFPVEVSAQSTAIGKEKVVLSIIRDITKRKAGDEALRNSEERYRAFIEHSSEGIWRFELEQPISPESPEEEQIQYFYDYGYLAECNHVMAQMYGFASPQEIIGARLGDLLVRSDPNNIEYLRAFIRSGYRLNDAESRELDKQGHSKYFLNNLVGIVENGVLVRSWGSQRDITERKQIEESSRQLAKQVQEQANTLDSILWASVDHIYILDRAGRYKHVSAGGAEVLGFKPAELIGKTWRDIGLPSDVMHPFDVHREEVLSTNQPSQREIEFSTPSGVRHYEYIIAPLYNQDRNVDGVIVVSRDVTDRKQTQEALRQSEERFRKFFEEAPIGISVVDSEGRLLKVNKTYCKMMGYQEAELNQLTFTAITHPEDLETDLRYAEQIFKGEIPGYQFEKRYIKKNGEILWVHLTATAIFEQDRQSRYRLSMVEDISDRKRTQEALRISEAKFRRLVEANIVGVTISEHGGSVKEANDAFLKMIGYNREELVARKIDWRKMTPPEYQLSDEQALRFMEQTGACRPFEKEYIRKDGSRVPILIGCALLEDSQDTNICFVLDLTDRKLAEQEREQLLVREQEARHQAEAANRMKDEFLATLSHELRTPLNAMLGWTQLLRTRKFNEATVTRALETIDRNTKSLSILIEDVLDVSRIVTGKLRLSTRPLELVPVIEAAIETTLPAAEAKGIQIESILNPKVGKVLGDSARLQQIVWNLLSNAVKFTPKGGRVEVWLEKVEAATPYVQIRVSDTGQGISPDFLPYVFERFRQADGATTRSHGGLGLGLAIVRHLVELQGGTVCAESPGVGQGATFIVNLPLMGDRREANPVKQVLPALKEEPPSDLAPSLDDLQVLVVDDEVDARELLIAMLGQYGASVTAVATADEALEAIGRLKPNILLSDIGMPEEDGYTLIRKVRALDAEQGGLIPAVALTAYARAEDRVQALLAGFQLHVSKPVNPVELALAIAKLTGRHERF